MINRENTVKNEKEGLKYSQKKTKFKITGRIRYYIGDVVLKPVDRDKMIMSSDEEIHFMI